MLISSPNGEVTSPDGDPENEFHIREYRLGELVGLLQESGFEVVATFGQVSEPRSRLQQVARSITWRLKPLGRLGASAHRLIYARILDRGLRPMTEADRPVFWVLECRLSGSRV